MVTLDQFIRFATRRDLEDRLRDEAAHNDRLEGVIVEMAEELLKARRAATVVYNYIAPGMEPFLWRDLEGIVSREEMQEWRDQVEKRDE